MKELTEKYLEIKKEIRSLKEQLKQFENADAIAQGAWEQNRNNSTCTIAMLQAKRELSTIASLLQSKVEIARDLKEQIEDLKL